MTATETVNATLMPTTLGSYMGQYALKDLLETHVASCWKNDHRLPHLLLIGTPGSGKTTLAHIVAGMLNAPLMTLATPPTKGRLPIMLAEFRSSGILFIDEIHEWSAAEQDQLLTLLEEGYISTAHGDRYEFPNITVIAATTEREKVRKPLMQRFPLRPHFEPYSDEELACIALEMANRAGLPMDWATATEFGRAAAGVPRQARTLILHAKALASSRTEWSTHEVLLMAGVEADGLTVDHLEYLARLLELGGEAGLSTMSARLRLHEAEVRDLERLLLDRKLITLSKTGRVLKQAGRQRLTEGATL